jgi:hypothetical protein
MAERRFLFEYRLHGAEWCLEIVAASPEEARERVKALAWAQYRGEVFATIRVPSAPVRFLMWLRAAFTSPRGGEHG